jgi:hypothetical protein
LVVKSTTSSGGIPEHAPNEQLDAHAGAVTPFEII